MVNLDTSQDHLEALLEGLEGPMRAGRERLVAELIDRGYTGEALLEANAADRLAVLPLEDAFRASVSLTARDVAARAGIDVAEVLRATRLLRLAVPDPDVPAFDDGGCTALQTLELARAYGLSPDVVDEIMSVLGQHLWQLAADVEVLIGNDLGRSGDTEYELAHRYADAAATLAPVAGPLVAGVFTAHLRERMQEIFVTPSEAELGGLRAVADVAVAFVDVVGFTELGERVDAGELKSIAGRLAAIADAVLDRPVRLVKTIGDAIMLMSRDTGALLDALLAINAAAMGDPELPPVHSGVAFGPAYIGGADVFGAPANLASRLTDLAPARAIWAAAPVSPDTTRPDQGWAFVGSRAIRGCNDRVGVFEVVVDDATDRD